MPCGAVPGLEMAPAEEGERGEPMAENCGVCVGRPMPSAAPLCDGAFAFALALALPFVALFSVVASPATAGTPTLGDGSKGRPTLGDAALLPFGTAWLEGGGSWPIPATAGTGLVAAPDEVKVPVSAGSAPAVEGRSVCEGIVGGLTSPWPAASVDASR